MYTNLSKTQAFSSTVRLCIKPQFLPSSSTPKPQLNPGFLSFNGRKGPTLGMATRKSPPGIGSSAKPRIFSRGFKVRAPALHCKVAKLQAFSSLGYEEMGGGSSAARTGKTLPWLSPDEARESKLSTRASMRNDVQSSWEQSARRLEEEGFDKAKSFNGKNSTFDRVDEGTKRNGVGVEEIRHSRIKWRRDDDEDGERGMDDERGGGEDERDDDPRWDKIKTRFGRFGRSERPEMRRWSNQENWGRKTWKEATGPSPPKMAGEGVYGVGPVLAALSAARREFYALYLQEGLDLSSNNRRKKDKKGFEKVLKIAEKIGLTVKEVSKHDLNMIVDNRPHQGLVLDASPLEMAKITELDPVSVGEGEGSLWVALDEVTDPQNLGAIIRSAYFFGASGVVLCAKNSAPLSGVVSKASAGSLELMELRYCKNMMKFLTSSAENGWRVLGGSVLSRSVPVDAVAPGPPTILVLGSEGTGLRPLVERSCTQLIRIPGNIPVDVSAGDNDAEAEEFRSFLAVESLNVSVAAGVLLHHFIGDNYKRDQIQGIDDNVNDPIECVS
ncbi:hypothetical protein CRG98_029545 [Punica granatum]|uniref:rRNA methyltransferase 1, mitochondrial n=1 Tax=Punica granatum TaxID=22663 RepID=A0A2I0J1C5_PUNGR|nr:hypothetical protein CRG98_029545 [Punica granatum]